MAKNAYGEGLQKIAKILKVLAAESIYLRARYKNPRVSWQGEVGQGETKHVTSLIPENSSNSQASQTWQYYTSR